MGAPEILSQEPINQPPAIFPAVGSIQDIGAPDSPRVFWRKGQRPCDRAREAKNTEPAGDDGEGVAKLCESTGRQFLEAAKKPEEPFRCGATERAASEAFAKIRIEREHVETDHAG